MRSAEITIDGRQIGLITLYTDHQPGRSSDFAPPSSLPYGGIREPPKGDHNKGQGGGSGTRDGFRGSPSNPQSIPESGVHGRHTEQRSGSGGNVDPKAYYKSMVEKFDKSPLKGYVPPDGAQWGITTGSPEEWARASVAVTQQESGFDRNASGGGLNQFRSHDLARYGVDPSKVNDPDAQGQALVNSWSKWIQEDKVMGGPDANTGLGATRYFGSMRRHGEADKYMDWAGQVAGNTPSEGTTTNNARENFQRQGPEGGRSPRANYFQRQGMSPSDVPRENILTPYGRITVASEAASDYRGFYNRIAEAGAPIKSLGSYANRNKRWGGGKSSHAYGAATDIDDATHFSPAMSNWVAKNPEVWSSALKDYNMVWGRGFPHRDDPHIEWGGPSTTNVGSK